MNITRSSFGRRVRRAALGCLFAALLGEAAAATNVRIATIGATPSLDKNLAPQAMVDGVIAFWRSQLQPVLPGRPDLILLPEYADLPREVANLTELRTRYCRQKGDQVLKFLESEAKAHHCYIVFGSVHETDPDVWRNSSILIDRDGKMAGVYDKEFPTIQEMESGIRAGTETPIFQCDFGRVAMALCFDLNFSEIRDQITAAKPDLILFSSGYHGGFVQSVWAYFCRAYFVSAVVSGGAPSEIRNPLGEVVATSTNYFDHAEATINLDCRLAHLDYNWERLTQLKAKYGDGVTVTDPGRLGCVLITSNDPKIKVDQMIKEFNIELLDDYFQRSKDFRAQQLRK